MSLSGGPRHPSPTSLSSLSTSLVAVVVWWGPCRPSPTIIVVVAVQWGFVGRSPCHRRQLSPTSSLSSAGHLTCRGLVIVVVRWGPCHPFPTSLSPAVPHSVVIVVIHGPFDLRRPCRRRCPVGCLVVRSPRRRHQPSPTSSSSLSSTGHLTCGGLVVIIVWWGALLSVPHVVVISHPPHHCRRRRHPWAICPAEASSSSLSGGGLVLILVVCGLFVLWRPRHRCCPMGASSLLSLSSAVLFSCRGLIPVIVVVGPCHIIIVR